jgi:transcriptional regulator with XRE-family HTH domain
MRRGQLGLTGAELAQRADISPSYVSLIENGAKVPDEDVAARLARALRDDEDLYRACARASRIGLHRLDWLNRLDAISRSPAHVLRFESGEGLEGVDVRQPAATRDAAPAGPAAGAPEAAEIVRVPVLAEGADPGRAAPSPLAIRDRLLVDSRLVGDHDPARLFAYDVTEAHMKHLRGVASPGDRVVLRRGGRVSPDRICAVRTPRGVVLSRVLFKGRALLLLPGEGERDFESVDVEGVKALPGVIAGTHVLLIRR